MDGAYNKGKFYRQYMHERHQGMLFNDFCRRLFALAVRHAASASRGSRFRSQIDHSARWWWKGIWQRVQVLGRMMVSRGDVGGPNRNLPPKVSEPVVIDKCFVLHLNISICKCYLFLHLGHCVQNRRQKSRSVFRNIIEGKLTKSCCT